MHACFNNPRLRFVIGDVRHFHSVRLAVNYYQPDTIVHAAAMKRIEACEGNPWEAAKTNVAGAHNIVCAARLANVRRVLAIGSDKGCMPINAYGATKLLAEKIVLAGNDPSRGLRCSAVRYGNVLGSRGSVVQVWRQQAERGDPLTITDAHMTRFWLTLEQAVRFVLGVLPAMDGGEVFVPKLPSMKVVDLAEAVAPNHEHRFIGIRPGEKLHESLIAPDEAPYTSYVGHYVIRPEQNADNGRHLHLCSNNNGWWLQKDDVDQLLEER